MTALQLTALRDPALRLLAEVTRSPWASVYQLADTLGISRQEVQASLAVATAQGWVQTIEQGLSGLPAHLFAPTEVGLTHLARSVEVDAAVLAEQLGCTPFRFWSLRSGLEAARTTAQFCACLLRACLARGGSLSWESFVARRYQGQEIVLHARLNLSLGKTAQAFYVLVDGGGGPVWMWWRHLRYFGVWSRRNVSSHDAFPPLLILTFAEWRAEAVLMLSRLLCGTMRVFACADREAALGHDPLKASWWMLGDRSVVEADPFDQAHGADKINPAHRVVTTAKRIQKARQWARMSKTRAIPNLRQPPETTHPDIPWLQRLELLRDEAMRVLAFVCLHPCCPAATISQYCQLDVAQTHTLLEVLIERGIVTCATHKATHQRKLKAGESPVKRSEPFTLYMAVEAAAHAWMARKASAGAVAFARRYTQAAISHARHAAHTWAVHQFFAQLAVQVAGWNQSLRPLTTSANDVDADRVSHYEIESFEDELTCTASYLLDGRAHRWMPDAYGVLRHGLTRMRFWLEIDGSESGPAHPAAAVWERKLGSLCGYLASGKWSLTHRAFPCLLIVTQDHRIFSTVADTLAKAATGFHVEMPNVFVASAAAIAQQGPLGKIWRAAHNLSQVGFVYAFPNAHLEAMGGHR